MSRFNIKVLKMGIAVILLALLCAPFAARADTFVVPVGVYPQGLVDSQDGLVQQQIIQMQIQQQDYYIHEYNAYAYDVAHGIQRDMNGNVQP